MSWKRITVAAVIVALVASLARALSMISSLAGLGYGFTQSGLMVLFAAASVSLLTVGFIGLSHPEVWQRRYWLMSLPYGVVFGLTWSPLWLPLAASSVLLVLVALLAWSRQFALSRMLVTMVMATLLGLLGFALVLVGSLFPGEKTTYAGPSSPSGLLRVQSEYFNPGAMASEHVTITVIPKGFPLVAKTVYSGNGSLMAASGPSVAWRDN